PILDLNHTSSGSVIREFRLPVRFSKRAGFFLYPPRKLAVLLRQSFLNLSFLRAAVLIHYLH
ncbi:hypothetical protein, partial [Sutterella wadsworthensis]|uniref:hypothetical protein n=1 Tax=Sutterella wadsworthensis TaxID=40545 RepID=UPI003975075C